MNRASCGILIRLIVLLLIIAGVTGAQASQALDDTTAAWRTTEGAVIKARIRTAYLLDRQLNVLRIDVDTEGRHVTLSGLVPSRAIKELAGEIALHADGVRSVKNELQVYKAEPIDTEQLNRSVTMARARQ